jgi:small subunit ribosomal protein S7
MNNYSEKSIIRRITNRLMFSGKRSKAIKILENSMLYIEKQGYANPTEIIINAVNNTRPLLDLRSVRKSGGTYQIPIPISQIRQESLAISWIVAVARKRSEKSIEIKLAKELLEANNNRGNSIKKRDALHKIGQSNRAFAHFRWQ